MLKLAVVMTRKDRVPYLAKRQIGKDTCPFAQNPVEVRHHGNWEIGSTNLTTSDTSFVQFDTTSSGGSYTAFVSPSL